MIQPQDEASTKRRITGWHLGTIALLMLGYSGYYFCRSDYSVALPLIVAEQARHGIPANVAEVRLGSIASLGVLAYAIGKIPSGALADRFGGRTNFLAGMAGSVVFTILFMLGGGFPLFTLAWIGNRFVQSMGWAGLVKVASRWFSYSMYGSVMGVLSLSYLFGDAISRGLMSLLLAHGLGWRGLFVIGAALLGVIMLANMIFLRESPSAYNLPLPEENPMNLFSTEDPGSEESHAGERSPVIAIFRVLLRSPSFWVVCLLSLGTTLLRETFNLWTPMYFTQVVGMTTAQAASSSALFPFSAECLCFWRASGAINSDLRAEAASYSPGLLLCVVALVALSVIPSNLPRIWPLALISAVAFLLIGPYSYLAGAMSLDFGGKEGSATASGVIDSVGYLAGVLSGGSMAQVAVRFGWHSMFLVLAGVALLSSAVAGIAIWQNHQRALAVHLASSEVS